MEYPSCTESDNIAPSQNQRPVMRVRHLLIVLAIALALLGGCGRDRAGGTGDSAQPESDETAALLQQYRQTSTPAETATEQRTPSATEQQAPSATEQRAGTEMPTATPAIALPSVTAVPEESPASLVLIPAPTSTLSNGSEIAIPEDVLPTATPVSIALEPTATPVIEDEPTVTETPIALPSPSPTASPTVTPTATPTPEDTPTPVSLVEREVVTDGYTLMRLALSGEGFDSTGRPINTDFEERTTLVGGAIQEAFDRWCTQLGLVHIWVDLRYQLDPSTGELLVTGSVSLHAGFCDDPIMESQDILGDDSLMDYIDVDLRVPTGTTAQITYNLQAESSLFGISGLLDSDTGVIVELHVTHKHP